jgi:hypothetical protein
MKRNYSVLLAVACLSLLPQTGLATGKKPPSAEWTRCLASLANFKGYETIPSINASEVSVFEALPWSHRLGGTPADKWDPTVWVLNLDEAAQFAPLQTNIVLTFKYGEIRASATKTQTLVDWVLIQYKGKKIAISVSDLMSRRFSYQYALKVLLSIDGADPALSVVIGSAAVDTFNRLLISVTPSKDQQPFKEGVLVDAAFDISATNQSHR